MSMIQFDVFGQLSVKKRLQLMTLPGPKRRRILSQMGRQLQRAARKRIQQQRNVDGSPWQARKDGSGRKMMRRLGRKMYYKATPDFTEISFQGHAGSIARYQQEGFRQSVAASPALAKKGQPSYDENASKRQAKALRDAGYKIRRKGTRGWRKPSLKWVQENLKRGQAGLIIKILRDQASKASWQINLPSRSFLGATPHEINQFVNTIFDNTINAKV